MMENGGISQADVIIGLIGGVTGSVLAIGGTWLLTKREERRKRQARLKAIEYEVRNNKVSVEWVLDGREVPFPLSRSTWDEIHIDLALDLPDAASEKFQVAYRLFADVAPACQRILKNEAHADDRKNVTFWRDLCYETQSAIAGELHPTWKLRANLKNVMAKLWQVASGLVPGRRK